MDVCLRVLKESKKTRLDSYSVREQCIDHIPYYLSGLSRPNFFLTTFLEIAVYNQAHYFGPNVKPFSLLNSFSEDFVVFNILVVGKGLHCIVHVA